MEEKNNKSLIVIIVILVLLVLGLGGFILYDKVISPKLDNTEVLEEDLATGLTEKEALSIGNDLWEYAFSSFWGGAPAWTTSLDDVNEAGGREINCDTDVNEVKANYTSDFKAQSCYSDGTSCTDYSLDDFVTSCIGGGRGGIQTYKDTTLAISSIEDNKIVFNAISEYCGSSFCSESNETEKEVAKEFIIVKENDKWLISYFYLPN